MKNSANVRNLGRLKDDNDKLWAKVIIVTFKMQ